MQPQSSLTISIVIAALIIGGAVFYSGNDTGKIAAENTSVPAPTLAPLAPPAAPFAPAAAGAGFGCGIPRS